jgi:mannitol-specific phosphotransferase system IIBC component
MAYLEAMNTLQKSLFIALVTVALIASVATTVTITDTADAQKQKKEKETKAQKEKKAKDEFNKKQKEKLDKAKRSDAQAHIIVGMLGANDTDETIVKVTATLGSNYSKSQIVNVTEALEQSESEDTADVSFKFTAKRDNIPIEVGQSVSGCVTGETIDQCNTSTLKATKGKPTRISVDISATE